MDRISVQLNFAPRNFEYIRAEIFLWQILHFLKIKWMISSWYHFFSGIMILTKRLILNMSVQIQPVHTQTFDNCVNPLKSVTFYNSSHILKLHRYLRLRALPIKHKYEIQHDAFSHIGSSAVGDWIWKCEISVFPQMTFQTVLQCPHHTLQILSISGIFRSYWANYKKWPTKWRRNKFKRAISAFSFEIPAAFQSVQFSRITLCRFWRFQGWCSAEKQLAGGGENKNLAPFPKNSHSTHFLLRPNRILLCPISHKRCVHFWLFWRQ